MPTEDTPSAIGSQLIGTISSPLTSRCDNSESTWRQLRVNSRKRVRDDADGTEDAVDDSTDVQVVQDYSTSSTTFPLHSPTTVNDSDRDLFYYKLPCGVRSMLHIENDRFRNLINNCVMRLYEVWRPATEVVKSFRTAGEMPDFIVIQTSLHGCLYLRTRRGSAVVFRMQHRTPHGSL